MRIIDVFDKGTALYSENIVFQDMSSQYRYCEASNVTHMIASALYNQGFGEGSQIAILAPNSNITFLTLLGIFRLGAIWLPINPRNSRAANANFLSQFKGELLLYHPMYKREAKELNSQVSSIRLAIQIDENQALAEIDHMSDVQNFHPSFKYEIEDTTVIFSSKSSKGIIVNHLDITRSFENLTKHLNYADNNELSTTIRHLVVTPIFHSMGLMSCAHFVHGGTSIFMDSFDPSSILVAIGKHRVTHLFVPPILLSMMLSHPDVLRFDYRSLQYLYIGASPISFDLLKQASDIFGPVVTASYEGLMKYSTVSNNGYNQYLSSLKT